MGTHTLFSSAYHPQTDGQTEHQNRMIEQVIRALVYEDKTWLECDPILELVVNSAIAEATGMLPAYFTFGQRLGMPVDCLDSMHPVQAAQDQVKHWEAIKQLAFKRLLQA